MPSNLQQTISDQIRVLTDDEMEKVLSYVNGLRQAKNGTDVKPISVIFEELSSEIPFDEWSELPTDGADNHDHYLYGSSKNS